LREFFSKYRVLFLTSVLLVGALLMYSANLRKREHTSLFEKTVLTVTAPFHKSIDLAWESVTSVVEHYLWLVETAKENERLRHENLLLRGELDNLREVKLANHRLRRLLDFKDEQALRALPAQVIAEDASSWARTVVIDKGTTAGVVEGQPVVNAEGVVGRVIKVGPEEARVLLITDAASAMAALVQRTRTRGVCRGRGNSLTLDFALRQEDIEVGDRVVTSGMGGVFPKGLFIGEVVRVVRGDYGLFQSVEVAPAADFSRLEEVLVLSEVE